MPALAVTLIVTSRTFIKTTFKELVRAIPKFLINNPVTIHGKRKPIDHTNFTLKNNLFVGPSLFVVLEV